MDSIKLNDKKAIIPLPKATSDSHIRGNIDIFDFALSDADMAAIAALDTVTRRTPPTPRA